MNLRSRSIKHPLKSRKYDKGGFGARITIELLDQLLRKHFDIPEGEIFNLEYEAKYQCLNVYYSSKHNKICEGGQWPLIRIEPRS